MSSQGEGVPRHFDARHSSFTGANNLMPRPDIQAKQRRRRVVCGADAGAQRLKLPDSHEGIARVTWQQYSRDGSIGPKPTIKGVHQTIPHLGLSRGQCRQFITLDNALFNILPSVTKRTFLW
jgi:hypothetical protein